MENTAFVALSRQAVLRREMDTVAHNIANMNTTGFKSKRMMFVDHLVRSRGGERLLGTNVAYVRDIAQVTNPSDGPIQKTGNPLDVALNGPGFFQVESEDGERYFTRNGRFTLNEQGQLVTEGGDAVLSQGGAPFFFNPTDKEITIGLDGTVATENGVVGQLGLFDFENNQELLHVAGGMFKAENLEPRDVERRHVRQGYLEGSNVEPIIEMTRMIEVHRSYERAKKYVESEDERQKKLFQLMSASQG